MERTNKKPNLDNPTLYQRYDPAGMFRRLGEMPFQCRSAAQMVDDVQLPAGYARVNKVIILGMGGSAIGGDIINRLVSTEARLPVIVHRDYELPGFVDQETLVIASSYSGNTEETLSSFEQALKTNARKLAITTGGQLKELALKNSVPVFTFDYPCQPRTALPHYLLLTLAILQRLGLTGNQRWDFPETADVLKSLVDNIDEAIPSKQNPAKQLALNLHHRLPVIYGAGITAPVAQRWKTQINENSKAWAFSEVFPELNHNAVVGYRFPKEMTCGITVVLLNSPLLSERIQRRYQITVELLKEAKITHLQVELESSDSLSQVMSLVLLGDYVSGYLALLNKTDPTPVNAIDYLKALLAQNT